MNSEVAQVWACLRSNSKNKRAKNLASSTAIVEDSGVPYKSLNKGIHLALEGTNGRVDFWPSTGKFKTSDGHEGRGIYNMLRHCDVQE